MLLGLFQHPADDREDLARASIDHFEVLATGTGDHFTDILGEAESFGTGKGADDI